MQDSKIVIEYYFLFDNIAVIIPPNTAPAAIPKQIPIGILSNATPIPTPIATPIAIHNGKNKIALLFCLLSILSSNIII